MLLILYGLIKIHMGYSYMEKESGVLLGKVRGVYYMTVTLPLL